MNTDLALHVLLALAVVAIAGHVVGRLVAAIRQPPVIGEVLSGILLGPSLLGWLAPGVERYLFPESARPALAVIAQLGIVFYMFMVGVEFDPASLRKRAAPFVIVSQASIAVPFALGAGLALALYAAFAPPGVRVLSFVLFMGVAMSVTAFPVLARILTDRQLTRTELGTAALTCAAVNDVTAWCLLAIVVDVARSTPGRAVWSALLAAAYIVFMFVAVRPIVARLTSRYADREEISQPAMVWTFAGLLLSAVAAEMIGIHAIFGAFLFGAILPAEGPIARQMRVGRTPVVSIVFLPAFFALTGLRTQIGLISSAHEWAICLVIIVLATAGKFGGTFLAGRLVGMPWAFAARLGVLMNTRGLMELVVLNVGLDIGVISPGLFTMMVIMALVTSAFTGPTLDSLAPVAERRRGLVADQRGEEEQHAKGRRYAGGDANPY